MASASPVAAVAAAAAPVACGSPRVFAASGNRRFCAPCLLRNPEPLARPTDVAPPAAAVAGNCGDGVVAGGVVGVAGSYGERGTTPPTFFLPPSEMAWNPHCQHSTIPALSSSCGVLPPWVAPRCCLWKEDRSSFWKGCGGHPQTCLFCPVSCRHDSQGASVVAAVPSFSFLWGSHGSCLNHLPYCLRSRSFPSWWGVSGGPGSHL